MSSNQISLLPAKQENCSDLAVLYDMATRGLTSHLWNLSAKEGQSALEVGRENIRTNDGHYTHYQNWYVAESEGKILGGMNGYIIPDQSVAITPPDTPDFLTPLNDLKNIAEGTWYISAAAVFTEARGQGIGSTMLHKAEKLTELAGCKQLTLMVGSFNIAAHRLYLREGFEEWDRRKFLPFPGSDKEGSWILMVKNV